MTTTTTETGTNTPLVVLTTGMPCWLAWSLLIAFATGITVGVICWVNTQGHARACGRSITLGVLVVIALGVLTQVCFPASPGWLPTIAQITVALEFIALVRLTSLVTPR